jgi:hypothetical protein
MSTSSHAAVPDASTPAPIISAVSARFKVTHRSQLAFFTIESPFKVTFHLDQQRQPRTHRVDQGNRQLCAFNPSPRTAGSLKCSAAKRCEFYGNSLSEAPESGREVTARAREFFDSMNTSHKEIVLLPGAGHLAPCHSWTLLPALYIARPIVRGRTPKRALIIPPT